MYSMKNIDGKESNTAKGVNIATEFNDFKDTLLNTKKKSDKKWEKFTAKSIKLEHMKSTKHDYLFFHDKRFVLNDGIHTLAYFHKDLKKWINTDDHK